MLVPRILLLAVIASRAGASHPAAPAPAAPAPAAPAVPDCVGHICPTNYVNKPNPASHHCLDPRGCSPTDCCLIITTTPVPTTTPTTCATFACPPPSVWHAIPGAVICKHGPCTKAVCCLDPTTTPVPTTAPLVTKAMRPKSTTPIPTTSPLASQEIRRKYDMDQEVLMQQTNKKTNNGQAGGAIAFFATGGFAVAFAIHVYRRRHNTRRVAVTSAEDGMLPSETDNPME